MSRRLTGVVLLFISAFLYASQYITAAIYASAGISLEKKSFHSFYLELDTGLIVASRLALIAGLIYLIASEIEAVRHKE